MASTKAKPGLTRHVSSPDEWHTLVCPQCRGVWVYQPAPVPPNEAPRRPRRKKAV